MKRTLRAISLLVPVAIGLAACSASDSGQTKFSSGLDGGLMVNTLTPTQQETICTSQAAFVRAHIDTTSLTRFWCAFTPAVFGAPDTASCETAMNACVKQFSIQLDVTASDPNAPPPQCQTITTTSCTGTVSQYEDCVNSLASVQLNIGTDFQCGSRAQYASSPTVGVDACKALGPTCTAAASTPPPQIQ